MFSLRKERKKNLRIQNLKISNC